MNRLTKNFWSSLKSSFATLSMKPVLLFSPVYFWANKKNLSAAVLIIFQQNKGMTRHNFEPRMWRIHAPKIGIFINFENIGSIVFWWAKFWAKFWAPTNFAEVKKFAVGLEKNPAKILIGFLRIETFLRSLRIWQNEFFGWKYLLVLRVLKKT